MHTSMQSIMTQPPVLHYSFYTRTDDEEDILALATEIDRTSSPARHQQHLNKAPLDTRQRHHLPCRSARTLAVTGRHFYSKLRHRPSLSLSNADFEELGQPERTASPDWISTISRPASRSGHPIIDDQAICTSPLDAFADEKAPSVSTGHFAAHQAHSDGEGTDKVSTLDHDAIARESVAAVRSTSATPPHKRLAFTAIATRGGRIPRQKRFCATSDTAVDTNTTDEESSWVDSESASTISNQISDVLPPQIDTQLDARLSSTQPRSAFPVLSSISQSSTQQPQFGDSGADDSDEDDQFPEPPSIAQQQMQLMVRHRQRHPDYIYQAPCEHYPCQAQTGYLVNDRCRKLDNLLSVVEFGVRAADCLPVTFKTVADVYLAGRELVAYARTAGIENIVQLIDTFRDDQSRRVFVLPRLRPLIWSVRDLVGIAALLRQLLTALQAIHQRGLVHLDINPSNMLQDADGHLVLIDFGLARNVPATGPQAGCSTCIQPCGTVGYIAPELMSLESSSSSNGACDEREDYTGGSERYSDWRTPSILYPTASHDDRRNEPPQQIMRDGRCCDMFSSGVVFALALVPYLPDDCTSVRCLGSSISTADTLHRARTELIESLNNPFRDISIPKVIWHAIELAAGLLDPNPATRWTAERALDSALLRAGPTEFCGTELASYQESRRIARYHHSCAVPVRGQWSDDDMDDTYGIYRY